MDLNSSQEGLHSCIMKRLLIVGNDRIKAIFAMCHQGPETKNFCSLCLSCIDQFIKTLLSTWLRVWCLEEVFCWARLVL